MKGESKLTPLISVIIPCYNHQKYIQEAIYSVVNQTYSNIELIILNDGSQDNSHKKILELEEICKARFTHFHYINKLNEGVAATLNKGLVLSKGLYISFCASDDRYLENHIETLVNKYMQLDDSVAMVSGNTNFIDNQGREMYFDKNHKVVYDREQAFFTSLKELTYEYNPIEYIKEYGTYKSVVLGRCGINQATMFVRQALIDVGMFNMGNKVEDVGIWLKIAKKYKAVYIDKILYSYRLHGENSVMLSMPEFNRDIIRLLLNEKEYCFTHGLKREWRVRFYNTLISMYVRGKDYKFVTKLLKQESACLFAWYATMKVLTKINKRIRLARS